MADTSRLLFPSLRFCMILLRCIRGGGLVMLPSHSPMFIWVRRLHDQLLAGELELARKVPDEAPYHCPLDMKREGVSVFVDLIGAKRSLVPALHILHRPSLASCLRVAIHDLDRHVALAREDKQPRTVGTVNFPICIRLFEPGQPPRSHKPVSDALIATAILAFGERHYDHTDKQGHYFEQ